MKQYVLIDNLVHFCSGVSPKSRQPIRDFYEGKGDKKGMKSDKISGTKKGVKCEVNECEATGDWLWEPLYEQFGQTDKYSSRTQY